MNGKEVFRFAVKCVPQVVEGALEEAGLTGANLDWLLLHQVMTLFLFCAPELSLHDSKDDGPICNFEENLLQSFVVFPENFLNLWLSAWLVIYDLGLICERP